ncbi:MAG: alpha-2-macroglobulin [Inhella sp.]
MDGKKQLIGGLLVVAALAGAVLGLRALETRGPTATQAQAGGGTMELPPDAPFAAHECAVRPFDERPALALSFTQPLDAKSEIDKHVRVLDLGPTQGQDGAEQGTQAAKAPVQAQGQAVEGRIVQGSWTLGENPRFAFFPNIQPQRRYRIEVAATLKSIDAKPVAAAKSCELAIESTPPAYYFASRGTVLPAGQNGGLPIVTINVPEVDVQFLRVLPQALPRFLERVAGGQSRGEGEGEGEYYDGEYGGGESSLKGSATGWQIDQYKAITEPVHLARYQTEAKPEARRVSFLPVEHIKELQQPGVYIAVMSEPGRFGKQYQVSHFYVSDIGLQLQRQGGGMSAFATSLKSGKALGDVRVELLDQHARVRAVAPVDGDGHARFPAVPADAVLVVARRGNEMSALRLGETGLDLSEFDIGGHAPRNAKLFAYAGRDLYRPGERFTLSVLARDPDGKLLPPQPIAVTLKRPDGRTVSQESWQPDPKRPGYLQHAVQLSADAQTGRWTAELRLDPAATEPMHSWSFQVEEFLPERMKLELKNEAQVLAPGEDFVVAVQGDYLYGAPAAGNRLIVQAAAERQREALPKAWPGFLFGDFADDGHKSRQQVSDEALDDEGKAQITLPVPAEAKSPMKVLGSFSLLESGGRPVVRSIERQVWPAAQLIGIRPLFDSEVAGEDSKAGFELIRVDPQGKPQPLKGIKLKLLREDRQYHWRFDENRGWQSGFIETDELVQSQSLDLAATRTPLLLPVKYGRYRLELQDPATGLTARYRFYAGWGAQEAERLGNRPDRVQLQWVKAPLQAGQSATLKIKPPHDGEALVTVQSGDALLWTKRISVSASGSEVQIPIDTKPEWARHDLYATVTAFRPGSQGDRVTPARAVGLLHLPLAREDRKLKIALQTPAKTEPERKVPVKIKVEGAPKEAWVTVSAVDVGILNITRYATPDAFDFFFGKHRFAPEWLDLYGKLIEKMDGQLARLKWGGDAAARDTQSMPKKVKLVDLFSGPVNLDAKGEASVMLDIPDFNGTLRLMAVAASGERYGKAQAELVSAAPIVAELSTPRFIAPGDQAQIALDVTNLSGQAQTVNVAIEGAAPLKLGGNSAPLQLKDKQRQILRFPVEANGPYGLAKITLNVSTASGIKLKRESYLQVQPPYSMEREGRRLRLGTGESTRLDTSLIQRFHPSSSQVSISVSDNPPLHIGKLVQGLLDYPYGCLEQTTSAAYPHLFVDEAAAKAWGLKPRTLAERQAFVEGALGRIAGMQASNGGFTLWGSGSYYEGYISAYVLGFLQDAKAAGFKVPESLQTRAIQWMQGELAQAPNRFPGLPKELKFDLLTKGNAASFNWRDYELVRDSHRRFAELAHIGYQLAREQKAPLSTLRYLHDNVRDRARSPLPLLHLSAALKLMGDERRAKEALDDAMKRSYGILPRDLPGYWWSEWLGDYGSAVRDYAMAYALMHRHELQHPQREQLLFDAADRLGNRHWSSTQEKIALVQAARAAGGLKREGPWTALLKAGESSQALESRSTEMRTYEPAQIATGVSLSNSGASPLFVELEGSGFPLQAPTFRDDVIELSRQWLEADGRAYNGRTLKVGEMLLVRVQARSKTAIKDALIVDHVPAGLEIENLNLSQGGVESMVANGQQLLEAAQDQRIKHREFRDDRYVAAAELGPDWVTVYYLLRVVSPGRFTVPAPFAEDMYRPELRGVGRSGGTVVIEDLRR